MIPSVMDLFRQVLASWQDDRLSENSKKIEEELGLEGFTVMLDNTYTTGSTVTIGAIAYVQMVGDIVLYCHDLRTPRVIARELAFPFRENKDCHDEATNVAYPAQTHTQDAQWDSSLQELVREHQERRQKNL